MAVAGVALPYKRTNSAGVVELAVIIPEGIKINR